MKKFLLIFALWLSTFPLPLRGESASLWGQFRSISSPPAGQKTISNTEQIRSGTQPVFGTLPTNPSSIPQVGKVDVGQALENTKRARPKIIPLFSSDRRLTYSYFSSPRRFFYNASGKFTEAGKNIRQVGPIPGVTEDNLSRYKPIEMSNNEAPSLGLIQAIDSAMNPAPKLENVWVSWLEEDRKISLTFRIKTGQINVDNLPVAIIKDLNQADGVDNAKQCQSSVYWGVDETNKETYYNYKIDCPPEKSNTFEFGAMNADGKSSTHKLTLNFGTPVPRLFAKVIDSVEKQKKINYTYYFDVPASYAFDGAVPTNTSLQSYTANNGFKIEQITRAGEQKKEDLIYHYALMNMLEKQPVMTSIDTQANDENTFVVARISILELSSKPGEWVVQEVNPFLPVMILKVAGKDKNGLNSYAILTLGIKSLEFICTTEVFYHDCTTGPITIYPAMVSKAPPSSPPDPSWSLYYNSFDQEVPLMRSGPPIASGYSGSISNIELPECDIENIENCDIAPISNSHFHPWYDPEDSTSMPVGFDHAYMIGVGSGEIAVCDFRATDRNGQISFGNMGGGNCPY